MKSILTLAFMTVLLFQAVSALHADFGVAVDQGRAYGSQFRDGVYTPIQPLMPYVDPTVRRGGYFGGSVYYLAGLRDGLFQEPYPPMNYNHRLQIAGTYYPTYPINWVREGGYFGERGVNLQGSPNSPGTFVFGSAKGRGAMFSGFN